MKYLSYFLSFILILSIIACSGSKEKENQPINRYPIVDTTRPLSKDEKVILSGIRNFGFNLFSKMITSETFKNKNLVISPFSISMALGMALMGAEGETYQQMSEVLGFPGMTTESVGENYKSLFLILENLDSSIDFDIANSVWIREGFPVYDSYISRCRDYFYASIFPDEPFDTATTSKLNNWVNEKTNGKISKIVDRIPDTMVTMLVNAIYFFGKWTHPFDPGATHDDIFTNINGEVKKVSMMQHADKFKYLESENFKLLSLPYGNKKFYMTIILPDPGISIYDLPATALTDLFDLWSRAEEMEVKVELPRFEYSSPAIEVKDFLKTLGMVDPFLPDRANFKGLTPKSNFFISNVMHKTYIKVDEKGTEAAAVTVVGAAVTCIREGPVFRVDHPFIFVIHDAKTKSPLFMGIITDI